MLPSIMYIYSRRELDSTSLLKEHIVARAPSKAQGETQGNQRKPRQSTRGNPRKSKETQAKTNIVIIHRRGPGALYYNILLKSVLL